MNTKSQEPLIVNSKRIACDGGDIGSGHPRVWLQISSDTGSVVCPYCDRKYVLATAEQK